MSKRVVGEETTWMTVTSEPIRLDILRALSEVTEATAAELGAVTHASESTLRKQLSWLSEMNVVREHRTSRDGVTPGRPATRFSLDPTVRANVVRLLGALDRSVFATDR